MDLESWEPGPRVLGLPLLSSEKSKRPRSVQRVRSEVAVSRGGMREDPGRRARGGRRLLPTHGGRWQDRWGRAAARTLPTRVGTGCCPSVDSSRVVGSSVFRHLDRTPCRAALLQPSCPPLPIAPRSNGAGRAPVFLLSCFPDSLSAPCFHQSRGDFAPVAVSATFDRTRRAWTARLRGRLLAGGSGDAGLAVLSGVRAAGRIGRHPPVGGRWVRGTRVRGQVPAVLRKTGPIEPVGRVVCRARSRPLRRSRVVSCRRSGKVAV